MELMPIPSVSRVIEKRLRPVSAALAGDSVAVTTTSAVTRGGAWAVEDGGSVPCARAGIALNIRQIAPSTGFIS